jgi:hypothetical protein
MQNVVMNWIKENMMFVSGIEGISIIIGGGVLGKYVVRWVYRAVLNRLDEKRMVAKLLTALIVPTSWLIYLTSF